MSKACGLFSVMTVSTRVCTWCSLFQSVMHNFAVLATSTRLRVTSTRRRFSRPDFLGQVLAAPRAAAGEASAHETRAGALTSRLLTTIYNTNVHAISTGLATTLTSCQWSSE